MSIRASKMDINLSGSKTGVEHTKFETVYAENSISCNVCLKLCIIENKNPAPCLPLKFGYGRHWRIYTVKFWTHAPPPLQPSKFFQFHAVFGRIWQNYVFTLPPPPHGSHPHLGEIMDPHLLELYGKFWLSKRHVKVVSISIFAAK